MDEYAIFLTLSEQVVRHGGDSREETWYEGAFGKVDRTTEEECHHFTSLCCDKSKVSQSYDTIHAVKSCGFLRYSYGLSSDGQPWPTRPNQ